MFSPMHVETLNFVVACPPTHRFARMAPDQHGQRGVRPADLAGERFVALDRELPVRREVDRVLRRYEVEVDVTSRVPSRPAAHATRGAHL